MRLFPPPLNIDPEKGFDQGADLFEQAEMGRGLKNLVQVASDPLVLALDGDWGTGKSTFLQMWAGELRNDGFPVIYFDAFKYDYIEDAFTALAGEIVGLAEEHRRENTPTAQRFLDKAVDASKVVLRSGAKIGVKAATLAALSDEDYAKIAGALSDEAGSLTDKALGELLKGQRKSKETLDAFRQALQELPELLAPGADKPLVFIIDELDRCRPAFALQLLERMKHFFSVPRVHFVLGAHLAQLRNSVVATYGPGVDAHVYLQKFIHLVFTLNHATGRYERPSRRYLQYLSKVLEFRREDARVVSITTDIIDHVAASKQLTLRTIERIMSVFAVALAYTTERHFRPPPLIGGLAIMKVIAPDLYEKAKRGTLQFSEVQALFRLEASGPGEAQVNTDWFEDWWRYCTDPSMSEEGIRRVGQGTWQYSFGERDTILPMLCRGVMDAFSPPA